MKSSTRLTSGADSLWDIKYQKVKSSRAFRLPSWHGMSYFLSMYAQATIGYSSPRINTSSPVVEVPQTALLPETVSVPQTALVPHTAL